MAGSWLNVATHTGAITAATSPREIDLKITMKAMLSAAVVFTLPTAVLAQTITPFQGFYIGFGGGAEWSLGNIPGATTGTGFAIGAKTGYDFIGPRVELEVGYGSLPTNVNIPGSAINGKVGQLGVMANVLYDFFSGSLIQPYVGAGAGVAFIDSNSNLGSTQFAYQAMVGAYYNISSSMRFGIEGRYVGTTNPSVNTPLGNRTFQNQNIPALAGVTWKCGAPDSAPPPPPASM